MDLRTARTIPKAEETDNILGGSKEKGWGRGPRRTRGSAGGQKILEVHAQTILLTSVLRFADISSEFGAA